MNTIKDFNAAVKLLDNARMAYENYMELREKALEFITSKCDRQLDQYLSPVSYNLNGVVSSVLSYDLNNYMECDSYVLEHSTELKYALKDAMNVKDWT